MKRILGPLFGSALVLLALAGPAAADYPPSPTHAPTHSPTQSVTQKPSVEGSQTHTASASASVLGETVTISPGGGTAFTGSDVTGPIALAGILLVLGLALLYLGRRRAAAGDR
jgi:LPXTG-motif cell wall-anchored protein